MSAIISTFLSIVLALSLSLSGQNSGLENAQIQIVDNTQSEAHSDAALEGNGGIATATNAVLNSQAQVTFNEEESGEESQSEQVQTNSQETSENNDVTVSELNINANADFGLQVSETAQSENTEIVSANPDLENHGQAVAAQAEANATTNAAANIEISLPNQAQIILGL